MYLHTQLLINEILPDEPDPAAANALREGLGGQFGEMRTMMQYLFPEHKLPRRRQVQALHGAAQGRRAGQGLTEPKLQRGHVKRGPGAPSAASQGRRSHQAHRS